MSRTSDPPTVRVRAARAAEWALVRELRLRALVSDPLAFGSTAARERALEEADWRRRLSKGPTGGPSRTVVALTSPNRFVGMAAFVAVDDRWHVFAMWVDPTLRGQGIGGHLLDAGLRWMRTENPRRPIVLGVNPRQGPARRLYESRGFRRNGRTSPLEHTPGESVVEMVLRPIAPPVRAAPGRRRRSSARRVRGRGRAESR